MRLREIKGKIECLTLVGHLPREISRFCKYFLDNNSELDVVSPTKSHRSPLMQGSLEKEKLAWRFSEK